MVRVTFITCPVWRTVYSVPILRDALIFWVRGVQVCVSCVTLYFYITRMSVNKVGYCTYLFIFYLYIVLVHWHLDSYRMVGNWFLLDFFVIVVSHKWRNVHYWQLNTIDRFIEEVIIGAFLTRYKYNEENILVFNSITKHEYCIYPFGIVCSHSGFWLAEC